CAAHKLSRVDNEGGTAEVVADAVQGLGGAWSKDGIIVFRSTPSAGLFQVPAGGGQPAEATRIEPPQATHRLPQFLPDSRHFLFYVTSVPDVAGIYVGSLDSKQIRRLFSSDTAPVFAPPDFVMFQRQGTLFAQHLNLQT